MKNRDRILALLVVGVMTVGCTGKDIVPPERAQSSETVTMTTTITLGGGMGTKALDDAGHKTFAEGDQIAIVYKNTGGETVKAVSNALEDTDIHDEGKTATITVTLTNPEAGGAVRFIYPAKMAKASIATDATMDDAHTINYDALATQDGKLTTLASNLDLAVYDGALTEAAALPANASLKNPLTIVEFTIKNADGSSDLTSTLTGLWVSDGTNSYAVSRKAAEGPIYVVMRPVAATATITFAAQTASAYYERVVTGKTLAAGTMYPVGVRMTQTHTVKLARLCNKYEAQNGETLTGKLALCKQISIAAGATVTLNNVDINGDNNFDGAFPGITCNGDATLTLEGMNTVRGCKKSGYPGIFPKREKTLTINGTGKLYAYGNGKGAAGIGGGYNYRSCGNIVIESGEITAIATSDHGAGIGSSGILGEDNGCGNITITGGKVTATGGNYAAGIGTGQASGNYALKNIQCGDITISGGTVTATGGYSAAGIGLGYTGQGYSYTATINNKCGAITITNGVTSVTAIRGKKIISNSTPYCIGKGAYQNLTYSTLTCGDITIGGANKGTDGVNPDPDGDTYVYQP